MSRFDDRLEQDMQHIADTATPSSTAWEAIQTRIAEQADHTELEITMLKPNPKTEPAVPVRMLMAAAAAILLVVVGLVALLNDGEEQSLRVTETDTTVPATTAAPGTTSVPATSEPSSASAGATAVALAEEFISARAAYDGDAARALVADDATIVQAFEWATSPDDYPLLSDLERAHGMRFLDPTCTAGSPGRVRCTYTLESDLTVALGVGPYDASFPLEVEDGLITHITHNRTTDGGQVGNYFHDVYRLGIVPWLVANHPEDLSLMRGQVGVGPPLITAESVALWEQHIPEFLASFEAADLAIAEDFITARNAHDGEAVLALFADDPFVRDDLRRDVNGEFAGFDEIDYVSSGEFDRVTGVELVDPTCEAGSPGRVRCTYTWANAWTRALGDDRYTGNSFVFDIADGRIESLTHTFAQGPVDGFEDHISEVTLLWVQANHPEDVPTMFNDSSFAQSAESLALWETYTAEFAASPAGN
ncbi:MAG: hypothetical protein EX269_13020 [Acidimicrobiales bacterium]|nr:MAG: hypothetical protein EX269_13020 [Acidimicrobiales bacterium]